MKSINFCNFKILSINGIPACANSKLLTDIARKAFNFNGFIVSDLGALNYIYSPHNYVHSILDAAIVALKAGVNLALAVTPQLDPFSNLTVAFQQGNITENLLRERVRPLFYTRMRLGEFDPAEMNPYSNISISVLQSQEHRDLALYAAMQSFVLLKNLNNYLPLTQNFFSSKKAAVN